MNLFELRWPELFNKKESDDWQQMYWETHLQGYISLMMKETRIYIYALLIQRGKKKKKDTIEGNQLLSIFLLLVSLFVMLTTKNSCLDEAVAIALLPSFKGSLADVRISGMCICMFSFVA